MFFNMTWNQKKQKRGDKERAPPFKVDRWFSVYIADFLTRRTSVFSRFSFSLLETSPLNHLLQERKVEKWSMVFLIGRVQRWLFKQGTHNCSRQLLDITPSCKDEFTRGSIHLVSPSHASHIDSIMKEVGILSWCFEQHQPNSQGLIKFPSVVKKSGASFCWDQE